MEEVADYVDGAEDSWLVKRKEHPYCAADADLKVTDVTSLLEGTELPGTDLVAADDASQQPEADASQRVTMYQCAQCKTTYDSLEKCVGHQCLVAEPVLQTPTSSSEPPAAQAEESQSLNYRWALQDTEALMLLVTGCADKFANPNLKRKFLWLEINDQMNDKGYSTTQLQCENRWKTLKAMYRKSQQSGSTPPFYAEMCDIAEKFPILMSDSPPAAADRPGSDKPGGQRTWTRQATLTMLSLVKARHKEFGDRSLKRRAFWDSVARNMKDIGMEYAADQCEGRFKTLLYAYRRVQLRYETTGEQTESDCYFQIDEIVQLVPDLVSPAPRMPPPPQRAGVKRRRRSPGGAVTPRLRRQRDLLLWLEQWLQEQRRWDDAMLTALQQQHQERQRTMQLVLEEVRSGRCRIPAPRTAQTEAAAAPQVQPGALTLPVTPSVPVTAAGTIADTEGTLVAQVFVN